MSTVTHDRERTTPQPVPQPGAGTTAGASGQGSAPAPAAGRVRIAPLSIVLFAIVFWAVPLLGFFVARFIDILVIVFLSVLVATFLSPIVNKLERLHLHRGVSILLVYLFFLGILFGIGWLAMPLMITETQKLAQQLPAELHKVLSPLQRFGISIPMGNGRNVNVKGLLTSGGQQATAIAGQAVGLVFSIGTLIVAVLSILVMAFFMTVQKDFTADVVNVLLPPDYRKRTANILSRMGERMGNWAIGQLIVTVYYAVAFSAGLSILHVPNALSVGVITGVLEIIPFIGGFIGVLLAVLVAATVNPTLIIWVILLYLIVTNVEAHILVPNIYGRAVNIHPLLVVVALLIGAAAFGIIGALGAVPLAAALQVVVEHLYIKDVVEAAEQKQLPPRRGPTWPAIDLTRLRRTRRQAH